MSEISSLLHYKDVRLDELGQVGNVAQFISFGPDLRQRFSRITGYEPNYLFLSTREAVAVLLEHAPERKVNIRTFKPQDPQGHEFIYGLDSVDRAERELRRVTALGLFAILNETVDVNDGGVSGVVHGGVMEFAPGETPRVVETGRVVSVSRGVGETLLEHVYDFVPILPQRPEVRTEFSIHPVRRGFRNEHTIIWESQEVQGRQLSPIPRWPNSFSEFIGDKVFGLLLADALSLQVPRTIVLCRNLPPFTFGRPTDSDVKWLRTSPKVAEPGLFPTVRGWTDPFKLMEQIRNHERVISIMIQNEVVAEASGALLTGRDENPIIEGVHGFGDEFMLGRVGPSVLNPNLLDRLKELHVRLLKQLGNIRAEWVFDGKTIWVIQLQQELPISFGQTIVPGQFESEVEFDTSSGLSGLHELIDLVRGKPVGIKIVGSVGMTSHIADVLRRNGVPSRIVQKCNP